MATLQELKGEQSKLDQRIKAIYDAADDRGDSPSKDELAEVKALTTKIGDLNTQIAETQEAEAMRASHAERMKAAQTPVRTVPFEGTTNNVQATGNVLPTHTKSLSLGHQVTGDGEFGNWLKQFKDRPPNIAEVGKSPRVELKTLLTGVSDTSAGALTRTDYKPILDMFYQRPLTIRDLITVGQTDSDLIEYVRVTGVTNNAATVAEATATSDGTGEKPESAMALAKVTTGVKTIAHWMPATTRALSDAAQIRTLIDSFLRYGLDEELEDQILNGDAAGENFDGITHVSNTTAQAFDTNVLTTTRKGRTKVRITGRARATAYVMNPLDWEAIDLLQDNEARYYYGGPQGMGTPRLWGLPVVESEAQTQGQAIVADWRLAILWDRMQAAISVSNSHADFFVRNLVAILAEMRAAFGVIRPQAFVLCDLTA
jgi:HK97 family phage major capsid protein